jgi:hypothetical protein
VADHKVRVFDLSLAQGWVVMDVHKVYMAERLV